MSLGLSKVRKQEKHIVLSPLRYSDVDRRMGGDRKLEGLRSHHYVQFSGKREVSTRLRVWLHVKKSGIGLQVLSSLMG